MSKPSAPKRVAVVAWILAVAALATVALLVSGHTGPHSQVAAAAMEPPSGPVFPIATRDRIRASYSALPLAFEANQGQADAPVKYSARGNGYALFLTSTEAVFAVHSSSQTTETRHPGKYNFRSAHRQASRGATKSAAIHMHLVDGNSRPQIAAGHELPGRINYYRGNDPRNWQEGVKQYSSVDYREVYPGVDMVFHGEQRQLEFDFVVSPEVSTQPIELGFTGADKIATDDAGNLVLSTAAGDVLLHKPVAYQEEDNQRQLVEAAFRLTKENKVAFALGPYDHSRQLVIDPALSYATFLGGSAEDDAYAIAIDSTGAAYVTGQTQSTNFPTKSGAIQSNNAGGFDVFVTKISADGTSLVYSTYVGGTGNDSGNAIAVDASGDAFVAGGTGSSNFPTTTGAFQTSFGGGNLDAFVFELAASGGSLTYSTYVGGTGDDVATGVALAGDGSGDTYIVGSTGSSNFPGTSSSPIQASLNGTSNGFVTKLNGSGNALVFSTYLGGTTGDFCSAVALDSSNNAYVTGATTSPSFPTTTGAFQTSCGTAANCNGGLSDAFVSVIKADGSGFVYSTFLGGGNADQGLGIAVDSAGDAYVTGQTQSNTDFPTKSAVQPKFGGGVQDAFVSAFNPSGKALLYSTYLGGSANDAAAAITIDGNKNVYVTGQTGSTNFPTANATQAASGGANDAFVTEVGAGGSALLFSTYLGGSQDEDSTAALASFSPLGAIAVDSAGANIYVAGNTASTNFPFTSGAFQTAFGGGAFDAFVAKYTQSTAPDFSITGTALAAVNQGGSTTSMITITPVNGYTGTVNFTCSVTSGSGATPLPTCSIPNAVSGGSGTSTLTVKTTGASSAMLYRGNGTLYALWLPVVGLSLAGIGLGTGDNRRRKLMGLLLLGLVVTTLFFLPACSSGTKSSGGGGGGCSGCTPTGNYTVTVTGTDSANSGLTHSVTPPLTLTVN